MSRRGLQDAVEHRPVRGRGPSHQLCRTPSAGAHVGVEQLGGQNQGISTDVLTGGPLLQHHEVPGALAHHVDSVAPAVHVIDHRKIGPGDGFGKNGVIHRGGELRHRSGKIIGGREAVADEQRAIAAAGLGPSGGLPPRRRQAAIGL